MIDGSKTRKRQLAFELQSSRVYLYTRIACDRRRISGRR